MSEPIKQTLFRFANMRSPELIKDESEQNFFVKHPDYESGPFFSALSSIGPEADKRSALLEVASSFTAFESVTEISGLNANLYTFSQWLIQNRTSLTVATATSEITTPGVTVLTGPQRISVWDNFFYQVLTNQSGYILDALVELLIADSFVQKYAAVTSDDATFQRLAASNVVLPKELFSNNLDPETEASIGISSANDINKTALGKCMDAAIASVNAALFDQAIKEMQAYQKDYNNIYASGYNTAWASYQSNYVTWAGTAATATVTDQFTGFASLQFTDTDFPVLSFSPNEQVNQTAIEAAVSAETAYLLQTNNLYAEKSLSSLINKLKELGALQTQKAFNASTFSNKAGEIGGTIFWGTDRYTLGTSYSFYLHAVKRATNNYSLLMTLVTDSPGAQINSVSATVGYPADQTSTRFANTAEGRVLAIDLTPTGGFTITGGPSGAQVTGTVVLHGGTTLTWDVILGPDDSNYGIMGATTPTGQSINIYSAKNYGIRRLGVADYKMVEQSLCCYLPGEVSHIENILAREYKERSTRRLRRSEDTTTTSSESERENLTDTSSTSRYEMQSEISEILRKDTSWGINANISAQAGPVNIGIGANYAQNTSKESSKRQSSQFAQELTQKASEKIVTKVKQERVQKIIEEFEEQNKHGFDNRLGDKHISGVYRWVDKEYKNELRNYGKRLMYEFMIPEPSRLHYEAMSSNSQGIIEEPLDPRKKDVVGLGKLENSSKLTELNYQSWAAQYNAEVQPPPALKQMVGKSYSKSQQQGDGNQFNNKAITDNINIPEGYGLDEVYVSLAFTGASTGSHIWVNVADTAKKYLQSTWARDLLLQDNTTLELDKFSESVPVSVFFDTIWGGQVNINLELVRKKEIFEAWQLETFNAIISSYENKLGDYKDQLAEAETKRGNILAVNPAYYREIEQTLLKKNCIEYMAGHNNMGQKHLSGNTFTGTYVNKTSEMDTYASTVKFFEQAFEWDLMTYLFYPFYWADKTHWVELYGFENEDPIFRDFMRAGMARLVLTVRPGFETAVMYYMESGQIWNGNHEPVIGDPMYLSIVDELKETNFEVEKSWTTRLPSTLTLVQKDSVSLDATGLPCWCDTDTPPTETIANDLDTLGNLVVFVDGYTPPASV